MLAIISGVVFHWTIYMFCNWFPWSQQFMFHCFQYLNATGGCSVESPAHSLISKHFTAGCLTYGRIAVRKHDLACNWRQEGCSIYLYQLITQLSQFILLNLFSLDMEGGDEEMELSFFGGGEWRKSPNTAIITAQSCAYLLGSKSYYVQWNLFTCKSVEDCSSSHIQLTL